MGVVRQEFEVTWPSLGQVVEIGRVNHRDADTVIDGTGMHVAPGFVDLHTHYDAQVFGTLLHLVWVARNYLCCYGELRIRIRTCCP